MTTQAQLAAWFDEGVRMGARNMVVKTDWFDHSDYPVYVGEDQDPREVAAAGDRTMEVYDLAADRDSQVFTRDRAFNYGEGR